MTNKITVRKTGTRTFTVYANGRPCVSHRPGSSDGASSPSAMSEWSGEYSLVAFKASGLARELGWPVFLERA